MQDVHPNNHTMMASGTLVCQWVNLASWFV